MDDMFDSSNSDVFTAIEGRLVEAGTEEDKPEGAEAIEADQGSDTMKNSSQIWSFYHREKNQKKKRETESIEIWRNKPEIYLIEYNA